MEVLTNLQKKILHSLSLLPDVEKAAQKDPGFDLYWFGIAMERINDFTDDSPDLHLLARSCTMNDLKAFFRNWKKGILKEIAEK